MAMPCVNIPAIHASMATPGIRKTGHRAKDCNIVGWRLWRERRV
jgi:hypothetical protein